MPAQKRKLQTQTENTEPGPGKRQRQQAGYYVSLISGGFSGNRKRTDHYTPPSPHGHSENACTPRSPRKSPRSCQDDLPQVGTTSKKMTRSGLESSTAPQEQQSYSAPQEQHIALTPASDGRTGWFSLVNCQENKMKEQKELPDDGRVLNRTSKATGKVNNESNDEDGGSVEATVTFPERPSSSLPSSYLQMTMTWQDLVALTVTEAEKRRQNDNSVRVTHATVDGNTHQEGSASSAPSITHPSPADSWVIAAHQPRTQEDDQPKTAEVAEERSSSSERRKTSRSHRHQPRTEPNLRREMSIHASGSCKRMGQRETHAGVVAAPGAEVLSTSLSQECDKMSRAHDGKNLNKIPCKFDNKSETHDERNTNKTTHEHNMNNTCDAENFKNSRQKRKRISVLKKSQSRNTVKSQSHNTVKSQSHNTMKIQSHNTVKSRGLLSATEEGVSTSTAMEILNGLSGSVICSDDSSHASHSQTNELNSPAAKSSQTCVLRASPSDLVEAWDIQILQSELNSSSCQIEARIRADGPRICLELGTEGHPNAEFRVGGQNSLNSAADQEHSESQSGRSLGSNHIKPFRTDQQPIGSDSAEDSAKVGQDTDIQLNPRDLEKTRRTHTPSLQTDSVPEFDSLISKETQSPTITTTTDTTTPNTTTTTTTNTIETTTTNTELQMSEMLETRTRCGLCDAWCHSEEKTVLHMKEAHSAKESCLFTCGVCFKVFPYKRCLLSHLMEKHSAPNNTCTVCSKQFQCRRYLLTHLLRHAGMKKFQCQLCGWRFFERHKLKFHLELHKSESERQLPYVCQLCGKKFTNKASWSDHCNTHSGQRPFACEVCGARFSHRVGLRRHKLTHNKVKPFSCPQCYRTFTVKPKLEQHMTTHTGQSRHVCPGCNKVFTASSSLKRHRGICHKGTLVSTMTAGEGTELNQAFTTPIPTIPNITTNSGEIQATEENMVFMCSECRAIFHTYTEASLHTMSHEASQ